MICLAHVAVLTGLFGVAFTAAVPTTNTNRHVARQDVGTQPQVATYSVSKDSDWWEVDPAAIDNCPVPFHGRCAPDNLSAERDDVVAILDQMDVWVQENATYIPFYALREGKPKNNGRKDEYKTRTAVASS